MKLIFSILAVFLFSTGCQHKPTKVVTQEPVQSVGLTAETLLQGQPVILDARPAFEFNMAHVPGAINVRWEDFSQQNPNSRGLLQKDLFSLARRLALIGVDPGTKVIVLGKGPRGMGEEGRIAWTLNVLGVSDVYTLLHSSYREMNTIKDVPPVQNKSYWKPQVVDSLQMGFAEFKVLAGKGEVGKVIIDVRSPEEFALRNLSQMKTVKTQVLNIPWQEFFDIKGLPRRDVDALLASKGLGKGSKIVVVSNHGVRSGAVVYALMSAGIKGVTNFAGGYEQWK